MFFFPLINFLFLIILYFIHKKIFFVTAFIETIIYVVGMYFVYAEFERQENQILYTFFLTGVGFIIALIAFFVAILSNQHHLYNHDTAKSDQ
jgi:uncharacterized protein YebE (UPF0316 family)